MGLAKLMFKLKNQLLPENFNSFFISAFAIHKYNTRINQSDDKFFPRERITFGQQKLEYKSVKSGIIYQIALYTFRHSLDLKKKLKKLYWNSINDL